MLDSLCGDGPTLERLEAARGAHYVVGANELTRAQARMQELGDAFWRPALDREEAQVARMWLRCEGWAKQRLLVCRRWREPGELFWRHWAVLTDPRADDPPPFRA